MEVFQNRKILRIREDSAEEAEDPVVSEKRVRISVNGKGLINLYCTPMMVREFVAGIVFNERLIEGGWCAERMSIEYGDEITVDIPADGSISEEERTVTSGCGGGISTVRRAGEPIEDSSVFSAVAIKALFRDFQRKSEVYKMTGGVHSAAVSDGKTLLVFAEDIGRHNAVDKAIGYCLLEQIPFEGKIMLASGRLSSEIVSKCSRCGIPLLVSRAAPTSLAVEIAESSGLTLIGFVRGERMNVYSGRQRISL